MFSKRAILKVSFLYAVLIMIGLIGSTSLAYADLLNIDFSATGTSPKTGPAVVGQQGDYWNPVHPVEGYNYQTDTEKINDVIKKGLKFANGQSSSVTIRMVNLGGGYSGTYYALNDPMFVSINYQYDIKRGNNGQPAFMYISNIDAGSYDLYLYGPLGRYQVSVNGKSYGRKDSTQNEKMAQAATQWVEGIHYQEFSDIVINPNDQIEIDLIPSDNWAHDAPISGLQLVPSGTPIVEGVIHGADAQAYVQQHDKNTANIIYRHDPIININQCQSGCLVSEECVPVGYRTSSNYCDVGGKLYDLKKAYNKCNNNFECLSNICNIGLCMGDI